MKAIHCALSQLSDAELLAEVTRLVRRECEATSDVVASLGEFDRRRLYLGLGYSSLFSYCVQALGLSEDAAYSRIEVARAARRFPMLLERLAAGAVSLTCARLLAPHLTEENHVVLLDEARGKSKRDVEAMIAVLAPRRDATALVRKLPARGTAPCSMELSTLNATGAQLVPEQVRTVVQTDVSSGPEDKNSKRSGGSGRKRGGRSRSRNIPAAVKREVWKRDDGCCAFVGASGRKCCERGFVEYHHVVPYADGGAATVDNVQLRCKVHNAHEASLYFRAVEE